MRERIPERERSPPVAGFRVVWIIWNLVYAGILGIFYIKLSIFGILTYILIYQMGN